LSAGTIYHTHGCVLSIGKGSSLSLYPSQSESESFSQSVIQSQSISHSLFLSQNIIFSSLFDNQSQSISNGFGEIKLVHVKVTYVQSDSTFHFQ
jgi:hypothetical protein